MKNILKGKKILKKFIYIAIALYVLSIFINQQKVLNSYKSEQGYYQDEIQTKLAYQESLKETKSNINSEEYIEEMAREKLDMYLPNERVYVDKDK